MFEGVIKAFKDSRREGYREGYQEGWQEGYQEGWQEEAWQEMARKLKARGRPLTEIAEDTGLPLDVIAAL
jgi:predicted transposase/invertase (TIGR01784 family)